MPTLYTYRARDRKGELVTGQIRGESHDAVEQHLESLDLIPVFVKHQSKHSFAALLQRKRRSRLEDLILVTRKLATLYRAGVAILRSLEIIADQYQNEPLGNALLDIRDKLERGEQLSASMAQYPHLFPPVFVSSIKAAEVSGQLDTVLERLGDALEQELITHEEVRRAVRYPIMVVTAIVLAFFVLTTFVVPRFAQFYAAYGAQLPTPTRLLIALSEFITGNWYFLLPAIVAAVWGVAKLLKAPALKPRLDHLALQTPVFGSLLLKVLFSRFSHVLGVLIASGIPLLKSLQIVRDAVGNTVIASEIGAFEDGLREGRSLSESRPQMPHFPRLVVSLLQIGLESGSLEITLREIASFFDREVLYDSRRLTTALEPLLIIVIGAMITLLALAIFLPMWNIITIFGP
jgi:type II secretory pathway component PulF